MQLTSACGTRVVASKHIASKLAKLTRARLFHLSGPARAIARPRFLSPRVSNQMGDTVDYSQGKLYARPGQDATDSSPPAPGLQPLGTGARRDGLIYTPRSYKHGEPAPLCIIMHGAGGNAKGALFPPLEDIAERVSLCHLCWTMCMADHIVLFALFRSKVCA